MAMSGSSLANILMMITMAALLLVVVSADIRHTEISSSKNNSIFLDYFGLKPNNQGRIELNLTNIVFSSNPIYYNLSQIGFFLTIRNLSSSAKRLPSRALYSKYSKFSNIIYTFDYLNTTTTTTNVIFSMTQDYDVYNLWYENSNVDFEISMNVRSAMYNVDSDTGFPSYLSAHKLLLPTIYSLFLFLYFSLASFWVVYLYKRRECVRKIHCFMLLVVIIKALSIHLELKYEYYIMLTGCGQCWRSILYEYTSGFLDGTPMIVLILLILSGWSYMKPFLNILEKICLGAVIFSGVATNYLKVFTFNEKDDHTYYAIQGIFPLFNSTFCIAMFSGAISSSIEFLLEARRAHGKASMTFGMLKQMRLSFFAFLLHFVFAVFVTVGLESFCPTPHYLWLSVALKESSSFLVYVLIVYKSGLDKCKSNILISEDEEKAAAEALNGDDNDYMSYITFYPAKLHTQPLPQRK